LKHARHGANRLAGFFTAAGKQRQDELRRVEMSFGDEPAQDRRLTQPARAIYGKSGQIHGNSLNFAGTLQKAKVGNEILMTNANRTYFGNRPKIHGRIQAAEF
jgi:hypothetical protein